MSLAGEILIDGKAQGPLLQLVAPICFWGGVDRRSGLITQGGHPQLGCSITGTVLALPGTIGSSSSSAILAELIRAGLGPAAMLLAQVDAILVVGAHLPVQIVICEAGSLSTSIDEGEQVAN